MGICAPPIGATPTSHQVAHVERRQQWVVQKCSFAPAAVAIASDTSHTGKLVAVRRGKWRFLHCLLPPSSAISPAGLPAMGSTETAIDAGSPIERPHSRG